MFHFEIGDDGYSTELGIIHVGFSGYQECIQNYLCIRNLFTCNFQQLAVYTVYYCRPIYLLLSFKQFEVMAI